MKKYLLLCFCTFASLSHASIKIGSKVFTESVILSEMVASLLELKYHQSVERRLNLGGTQVVFDALKTGQIDLYIDYTGTGYLHLLKQRKMLPPEQMYQYVKKEFARRFQIIWSEPIGFNNTYALAKRKNDARLEHINKISQIKGLSRKFNWGSPHEFMQRVDGMQAFLDYYGFSIPMQDIVSMEHGLLFRAIKDDEIDLMMTYSTDGRLLNFGLEILDDDLNFFPPYYASILVRKKTLNDYPVLKEVLSDFKGLINEHEMIFLNNEVDTYKKDPKKVAMNYLIDKKLIYVPKQAYMHSRNLFSYFWQQRNYLAKIIQQHILLSLCALVAALLVSLPLGIVLTKAPKASGVVFTFINTIQTIPSLALFGLLIPIMGIGYYPALCALFLYSLLPLIRNTYAGMKGVDAGFLEAAKGIGLTPSQTLWYIQIPLAFPVILAGVRTASVIIIGTATLAALVGAGGLGEPIFRGVATVDSKLILLGAIPSALLAILVDKILSLIEFKYVSKGLRVHVR